MATYSEMSLRLLRRFNNVPNVAIDDARDWTEEALLEHGYKSTDDVPDAQSNLILLYAQAFGAMQISLQAASYFRYNDAEEQVDKTMVSEQYRKLAADLRAEYQAKKAVEVIAVEQGTAAFKIMRRADRP